MRKGHFCGRRCTLHLLSFYTTALLIFASTSIVIWNFRDECYQFRMPPSGKISDKCRQPKPRKDLISFEVTKVVMHNSAGQKNLGNKNLESKISPHRGLRTALGTVRNETPSSKKTTAKPKESKIHTKIPEINKPAPLNASDYFKERREKTNDACLKMFYDEESINFDMTDGDAFLGELTKLEKLERGEKNKFFVQTNPQRRTKWIFYKHFDPSNHLEIQWCPLYKSGSTPWMAVFTKLVHALTPVTEKKIRAGKITFQDLAKDFRLFIPRGNPPKRIDRTPKYSMVVVRHPFKRILSAYQDKIERIKGREFYYKKYSKVILRQFRPPASLLPGFRNKANKKPGSNPGAVPAWYLMALDIQGRYNVPKSKGTTESIKTTTNQPETRPTLNKTSEAGKVMKSLIKMTRLAEKLEPPTFLEFCRYLLKVDPKIMDEHWRPQYLDCSPCHHKFDLILKVETMEKDKQAVFKLLGYESDSEDDSYKSADLQELEDVWQRWTNPSKHLHNASYYFSQLSEEIIQDLYHLYEPDFLLYDYSPDEYFDMVKQ